MAKDSTEVIEAKKRKCTPEQITAWRYFSNIEPDGCLKKWNRVSDSEYDALIQKRCAELGLLTPERALKKLGLDESDLANFAPIMLQDYIAEMSTSENRYRRGEDKVIRTSNYQVTWLLCSENQVYVFQCTFSMLEDDKKDVGEEYFFKDVTNFSTTEVSDEVTIQTFEGGGCGKSGKEVTLKCKLEKTKFRITVPGEKLECAMTTSPEVEANIKRLKALLREKKS